MTALSRASFIRSWVGMRLGVEVDDGPVGVVAERLGEGGVLGGDEEPAAAEHPRDLVPVERRLGEHQHGVGRQTLHEVPGRLQQRDRLAGQTHASTLTQTGQRCGISTL